MVPEIVKHFIGGRQLYGSYRKTWGAVDPATGKEYAQIEVGGASDINHAVLAARQVLEEAPWGGLSVPERAGLLERIADGVESRAGEIADYEALGTGLPVSQGRAVAAQSAECFRLAAAVITQHHNNQRHEDGTALRRPAGVAGVVTSWRAPFLAQARAIAPALAAGCTVVLQPDVWAPLSAVLLQEITVAAGLPDGVLNVVHGTGDWRGSGKADTGARDALVTHPGVPVLSFAGDSAAGERAGRDAAVLTSTGRRKRLAGDLAGNSPCVIFADADLDLAARSALFGAFALNGGRRTATSRILAERPVYDAVLTRFAADADGIRVGAPADPATELGPLVHADHYARVMSCVRRGIREGARLVAGGRRPAGLTEGNYLSATVLADVTPEMSIFAEVSCGPVACVTPFDTEEEAIALANAANAAMEAPGAYIWTSDLQRARRLAAAVDSPMTWVNAHNVRDLRTPPGGEGGRDGIDFYLRSSAIHVAADDGPAPRLGG